MPDSLIIKDNDFPEADLEVASFSLSRHVIKSYSAFVMRWSRARPHKPLIDVVVFLHQRVVFFPSLHTCVLNPLASTPLPHRVALIDRPVLPSS